MMSNKKNMLDLSISDTDNNSNDFEKEIVPETTKRVYNKKNTFTEKELEQLTFMSKLKQFEKDIDAQYETIKRLKFFTREIKQAYQQDIVKIRKMKRHKEKSGSTGFNKKFVLPEEFCNLIGEKKGIEMTTPEFASKVYYELKKRGLQYQNDKRIYRVDKDFMEVLGIKESVNKSFTYPDENGFNIGTMQGYISESIKKYKNKETKELEEPEDHVKEVKEVKETKIKVSKK
jgi:hypothetical protein